MADESIRSTVAFKIFYVAFVGGGVAFLAYLVQDFPIEKFREVLIFVGLIIVADTAQISLPRGGASIYASSPLDLAGIVLLGTPAMAVVEALASIFSQVVIQRRPALKIGFNVPLLIVTVGIAGLVYYSFPEHWCTPSTPYFMIPLTASGISYFVVNTTSVSMIVALQTRKNPVSVWKQNYMWAFFHIFAFLPLAAVIAMVFTAYGAWTVGLFVVPIFLARYSFKLYLEMKEAHVNTVAALASAIDANDPYTHGHSYRVSRYALRIGRALDLNSRDMEILEYGALLHDIGKIAIQKDILMKAGRLTDQEFMALKQHPTVGADIVENLKFLKEASVLVRYHHEQPNGRGYPDGLMGDDIPLGARIIMCADAFDAMTSDRPYRKGLAVDAAIEQFRKFKGEQFDYEIATLVLDMISRGHFELIVEHDPTTAIYDSLRERL